MIKCDNGWVMRSSNSDFPSEAGFYRVMISGDSESVDGFTVYDYPDYAIWAWWEPANQEEYEDFDGGYKGSWNTVHGEENEMIFAFFGPIQVPDFKAPTA